MSYTFVSVKNADGSIANPMLESIKVGGLLKAFGQGVFTDTSFVAGVDCGDGSDGDVTISGTVTPSRTMFYRNLTLAAGGILNSNGQKIYAHNVVWNGGTFQRTANNGATATTQTGGAAGAALASGDLGGGGAGSAGGTGVLGIGALGAASAAVSGMGASGGAAGAGGAGVSAGAAGRGATAITYRPIRKITDNFLLGITLMLGGVGAPGGTSGGGDNSSQPGRGGGGGGGGGGFGFLCCDTMTFTSGSILFRGGNGGAGAGTALVGVGCGGGGGGGGGGVFIAYVNRFLAGKSLFLAAINVSGGTGGAGGIHTAGGNNGSTGANGATGRYLVYDAEISTFTGT